MLAFKSSVITSLSDDALDVDVLSREGPAEVRCVETADGLLLGSIGTACEVDRRRRVSWAGVWVGVDLVLNLRSSVLS